MIAAHVTGMLLGGLERHPSLGWQQRKSRSRINELGNAEEKIYRWLHGPKLQRGFTEYRATEASRQGEQKV